MTDLEATIELVRSCARTHQDYFFRSETATKYALIDPVLRSLGWMLDNPEQVKFEIGGNLTRRKRKRCDYALFGRDSDSPLVIVEAKRLSRDLTKAQEKDLRDDVRAVDLHSEIGVLTNGDRWQFYDLVQGGRFPQKLFDRVSVLNDPIEDCAKKLRCLEPG